MRKILLVIIFIYSSQVLSSGNDGIFCILEQAASKVSDYFSSSSKVQPVDKVVYVPNPDGTVSKARILGNNNDGYLYIQRYNPDGSIAPRAEKVSESSLTSKRAARVANEGKFDGSEGVYLRGDLPPRPNQIGYMYIDGVKKPVVIVSSDGGKVKVSELLDDGTLKVKEGESELVTKEVSLDRLSRTPPNNKVVFESEEALDPSRFVPRDGEVLNGSEGIYLRSDSPGQDYPKKNNIVFVYNNKGVKVPAVVDHVNYDRGLIVVAEVLPDGRLAERAMTVSYDQLSRSIASGYQRTNTAGRVAASSPEVVSTGSRVLRTVDGSTEAFILDDVLAFGNDLDTVEDLMRSFGLTPKHALEVDNARYTFSDIFLDDSGRKWAYAVVEVDGRKYLRTVYLSQSQNSWRLLPAVRPDGGYDKLDYIMDEDAINMPNQVQKFLGDLSSEKVVDLSHVDGINEEIVKGVHRKKGRMQNPPDEHYPPSRITVHDLVSPYSGDKLQVARGHPKTPPAHVDIPTEAAKPDFSRIVETKETYSRVSGTIKEHTYLSQDGTVRYIIAQSSDNKVWVKAVESTDPRINEFGLRSNQMDVGDLTTPLWEYGEQIPWQFTGPQNSADAFYSSAWNYVSDIPIIDEWYKATGVAKPPKDLTRFNWIELPEIMFNSQLICKVKYPNYLINLSSGKKELLPHPPIGDLYHQTPVN